MKKHLMFALIVMLAAGISLAVHAQKQGGKPSSGVASCNLTFNLNDPESSSLTTTVGGLPDPFTGAIEYVNRDRGLRCEIDTNTRNFFLDLNFFKYSGVRRQAWIDLNYPAPRDGEALGKFLTSDFFFAVGDLWSMEVGTSKITSGQIQIPINGSYYSLFLGPAMGRQGTGVQATRTSAGWVLHAPEYSVGELMVLGRNNGYQHVGLYYFGFTITIEPI